MRTIVNLLAVSALLLTVSACARTLFHPASIYCREHPVVCALLGFVVVGGVVVVGTALSGQDTSTDGYVVPSDGRLKDDVRFVQTTPEGFKVYSFRYKGDDQMFLGLVAQDLLEDARYSHAVRVNEDGFYAVDYGALGLRLFNGHLMLAAGERASGLAS